MASALERLRKARQGSGTSLASANIGGSSGGLSSGSGGSSALAKLRAARSGRTQPTLTPAAQRYAVNNTSSAALKNGPSGTPVPTGEGSKNRGGLLGGMGYTLEKVGLSAVQSVEGIFDSVIGGVSDLFGADKFAERQFANDWLNYNHADEWYDATGGWKLAGNLGSAVGSSIPTTAAALVATIFTSGAALPMLVSGVVGGLSAMGSAVKEAYQETGELSGEEWGYGVQTGATEGLMEAAMGALGAGAGAIGKRIGQAFGKTAAKEVGKTTLKTVAKDIGKDFLSEAFEEGMSEFLSPYYKRATYDPSAKNATAGEIGYAALVGGLSGVLMSGAGTTATQALNVRRGSQIESKGGADKVMVISETILNAEGATKTKVRSVNAVRELYHDLTEGKLKITEGQSLSVAQKRALGELQVANMSALFQPKMVQSARNVLENSESIAERLNTYGTLKMVDGKFTVVDNVESFTEKNPKAEIRDITAEDIRRGFKKDSDNALVKALEENDVLRYVVASDVAGRLIMSVDQFEKSARAGTKIQSQVDLNNFIERATPEQKHALGAELGIADNEWATLKLKRFNEAAAAYRESGKLDAYKSKIEAVNKAKSVDEAQAKKKIPSAVTLGDGKVQRYKTDKVDIAVYREGENYVVYDYNEKAPSRALTRAEVNNVLEQMKGADSAADVAKTLKTAKNTALTNTDQGNVSVSGGNSLSPSARMAIDVTEDGKVYVEASRKIINGTTRAEQRKEISNFFSQLLQGGESLDIHTIEGDVLTITKKETADKARDDYKYVDGNRVKMTDEEFAVKMRVESHIDEVAEVSRKKKGGQDDQKNHDFAEDGFTYRKAYFKDFDGQYYEVTLSIGHNGTVATVYNVGKIKESVLPSAKVIAVVESKAPWKTLSNTSISQKSDLSTENSEISSEKSTKERVAEVKEKLDVKNIEAYCRENIEDYAGLSAANQSMVRQVVREGRAYGLDDADVLSYARVAARSGVNIEFDADMKVGNATERTVGDAGPYKNGNVAGYYDPENNRIVVNPKAAKRQELILIHELDHALRAFRGNDGKVHYLVYKDADKRLSDETWKQIQNDYADQDVDVTREELLADEASAYYTEAILGGKGTVDLLLGKNGPSGTPVPTMKKILNFFTGAARAYSKDAKLSREARRHYKCFKKLFDSFAERNKGRNAETAVESTGDGKAARRSANAITPKISIGMTDEERYEIIKTKEIVAPFYEGQADALISNYENKLESKKIEFAKEAILEIAEKLGIVNATINIEDVEVEIKLSKSNLKESVVKDATPKQIAKLLPILSKTVQKATIIERHSNRYYYDTDTVYFDNLLGAYVDRENLVPVRFGLKHSRTGATTLYVIVDQNKIPLEKIGKTKNDRGLQDASPTNEESDSLRRSVTYSIPQIVPFVNSKDLLRYLPDGMLDEEQLSAKWKAVAETIRRTDKKNDEKYAKYIEQGNLIAARQMVLAKARAEGYTVKAYHGTPNPGFTVFKASEEGALGKGMYFAESEEYAKGRAAGSKPYEVYLKIDKPYEVNYPGGINQQKLITQGYNGVHHEGNGFWVAFYPDQIKSADPVTYDDDGNVIPLSERFNPKNKDIRFSKDITPKVAEESGIEKSIGKLGEGKVESAAGRDAKTGARRAAAYSRRRQDMTVGQLRQMVARYTGEKVYTSKEARETIDNIWGIFTLSGKNRAKLYEALWQGYNSCKTDNERAEFSYDMAEYITVMMLAESSVANPDKPGALETLSKLKHGIGHLTFGEIERGDLRHVLDKKGYKKFIGRWGYRETMQPNRRRIAVDVFIHNLGEENPEFAYLQDMTPQDAILELDRVYERTIEESKATVGVLDDMPDAELRGMIDDIGTAIYESFRTKGEKSTAAKVIEAKIASTERKYSKLKQKYDELERKYYEEQGRPKKLLNLSYQIQKMKDLRLGTFLNATDFKNEVFKQTFEILGTIEFRGDISPKKVRLAMKRLAEWYKADNPVLKDIDGVPGSGYYSEFTALLINNIAEGEGGLSMFELNALDNILRHATNIVESFNRVWKGGKWVKADSTAKGFVEAADSARNLRSSADMRKISRLFDNVGKKYLTAFGDPMTLFRYMDGYQDGFFTWAGEELRTGAFRHGVDVMEMKADYDAFLEGKSHKGYVKKASKEAVEYGGVKMSKLQYISLYMTMQRQQAQRGLAENGFSLIDVTGQRVEVDGFLSRGQERLGRELGIKKSPDGAWKISDEQMKAAVESEISMMKKKLTDEDLEFIGIIERTLNGKCKELKSSRDMERLGYSNTISGYYYPIVRAMIAKTIDSQGMWGELDRASNISANKDTVKGAAGALWIESADTVFNRHIDAVARYAELSPAIDAINKIFNLDISGNKNKPRSVRTVTFNSWQTSNLFGGAPSDVQRHNGEAYLKDLLADLQGIGKNAGIGEKFAEGLRGGFAISALAANPKVLMTQLSSVLASTNILSMKSISTGMRLGFGKGVGEDVDGYCPVAKLRNYDSSAAKAQGVIENVRGVGEKLMTLVSAMDRGVVRMLWGACQAEVESTKGHKIGTEENKVEAGKLLERVIQETQQNSIATEKSAAMRSKSMLMKSLTMFTSDAMKSVGRVIDAFGHLASLNARIKAAKARGDAETAKTLKGEREGVMKQARKSVGALVLTSVYMTLIARAFSWLYAKDEEEERPVLAFIADVFGGMLGGLPIISDIYEFFVSGYDLSDNVYDTLNGVLEGVSKVVNTAGKMINGEATAADMNGAAIYFAQTVGTVLGLPIRNIRNMVMGLTRRFNPNAAYRMEMLTKSKNYASDFEEAVEAGDDDKAMMILGLLLEERLGTDGERTVGDAGPYMNEILRMEKAGYNILPRTIGSTVTIAGEEIDMTPEEQTALRARYSEATGHIEALIGSAEYAALSDEQKESAIRFIYDAYYDVGIAELYGYERNLKRRLFSRVISVEKLALANAVTAGLESDHEDGRGKAVSSEAWAKIRGTAARVNYSTVQGSKRKKVIAAINKLPLTTAEKLLIIAYKGYTVKDGDIRGVSAARAKQMLSRYARGQGLSKDEARALEEYL